MYDWPSPEPMSEKEILDRAHRFWLDIVSEFGADYLLSRGVDFSEVYMEV